MSFKTLAAKALGLTTNRYSTLPLGIDVSHWKGNIDWPYFKSQGLAFAVAKSCELQYESQPIEQTKDDMQDSYVQGAYENNIPMGLYIFNNPEYYSIAFSGSIEAAESADPSRDKQILCLQNALKNKIYGKSFHFLVIDYERWWIDYGEYNRALSGQISMSEVRKSSPKWVLASGRILAKHIKKVWPDIPLFIYSRDSFVKEYTKLTDGASAYDWMCDYPTWEARYYNPAGLTRVASMAELREKAMPPETMKPSGMNSTCWIWQFNGGSYKTANGQYADQALDWNMLWGPGGAGDLQAFYSLINFTPGTPPVNPPTPPTPGGTNLSAVLANQQTIIQQNAELLSRWDKTFVK